MIETDESAVTTGRRVTGYGTDASANQGAPRRDTTLRMAMKAELSALKPSELSKRAAAHGVAQADIDRAVDSDNPKELLVDLIVRHAAATAKLKTKKKARRSQEGGLSKGQACCAVSCTVLALAAMCGSLCMFSVRVPFFVLRAGLFVACTSD